MSEKVKIALCGVRGHVEKFGRLINSYEESLTIGVWDPDYDTAKRVAENIGKCTVFTDYDELLKMKDLDGVVIPYHNYMHKELAVKAARAGKNIFLEKPIAPNIADAKEICDSVRENGVKFLLSDPFVNGSTRYLKAFIESGKLGELRTIRIRRSEPMAAIRDANEEFYEFDSRVQCGGHMIDQGGHALHILHYIMGKPDSVFAKFVYGNSIAKKYDYEQMALIAANYPNEVTAIIESGLISSSYCNCVEISGTNGTIIEKGGGDKSDNIRYKIFETPKVKNVPLPQLMENEHNAEWIDVPKTDIPEDPDDHIRYWVKMQAYDIPNEQVGVDPASLHGMSLDAAYEVMEIIDAVYRSNNSNRLEKV